MKNLCIESIPVTVEKYVKTKIKLDTVKLNLYEGAWKLYRPMKRRFYLSNKTSEHSLHGEQMKQIFLY